jgi:hypothetical protein
MLPARPGLTAADPVWLFREALPIHKVGGSVPLGEDNGAVPPGTERVENAVAVIGIGLVLLLMICAILIAVRGRKR